MSIEKTPRMNLGVFPTPLEECEKLTSLLKGPRLLIKRDDLTTLGAGGNKVRKLEFIMALAKQKGYDTIITTGSSQSNHAGLTAAAAAKFGMDCYLVLFKGERPEKQGNMLLFDLYNANVEFAGETAKDLPKVLDRMDELLVTLKAQGKNPYVVPMGGHTPEGVIGYALMVKELRDQAKLKNIDLNYIVCCAGTGSTMAGVLLGVRLYMPKVKVIGISVLYDAATLKSRIDEIYEQTTELLGENNLELRPDDFIIYDNYIGKGYGIPSKEGQDAIRFVASTEAILLDPVYTGKTMAGMIDLINKGTYPSNSNIVFLHTGGIPGLFAYNNSFSNERS